MAGQIFFVHLLLCRGPNVVAAPDQFVPEPRFFAPCMIVNHNLQLNATLLRRLNEFVRRGRFFGLSPPRLPVDGPDCKMCEAGKVFDRRVKVEGTYEMKRAFSVTSEIHEEVSASDAAVQRQEKAAKSRMTMISSTGRSTRDVSIFPIAAKICSYRKWRQKYNRCQNIRRHDNEQENCRESNLKGQDIEEVLGLCNKFRLFSLRVAQIKDVAEGPLNILSTLKAN
ncbi:hypothetical protein B0H16DRAFT_1836566 [Mycena metata]|uniref:Secreted protein n=1 Tax=Mycena metata TaxID=1033252 RepID=A0AAD7DT77_9AGAR|nr:hypothetical protein B0H16DRAFT_1836566 [Mycena metata]